MADRAHAIMNDLNRRAREVGLFEQKLTLDDLAAVRAFYDFTCLKCGKNPATSIDHVKPLIHGGQNTRDNCQLLCTECNKQKRDDEIDYRNGKVCPDDFTAPSAQDNRVKHEWQEIEGEYVISDISTRDLAHRFGVPYPTLRDYSIAHEWDKQRQEYRSKVVADTMQAAQVAEVSSRVMILQAAREALMEWRRNRGKQNTADLAKILELAARVEGMELDKRTLTVKDWRDAATKSGEHADDIQQFATNAADDYYSSDTSGDRESGAGWTD